MSDPLREMLEAVRRGEVAVEDAIRRLRPTAELGFANVDLEREARCGFPEVVFGAGKTAGEVVAIARAILGRSPRLLLTRASAEQAAAMRAVFPEARHHERARCVVVDPEPMPREGHVAVVAAGTADQPVAEEAALTAAVLGAHVTTHLDVGVAGLHRLLARLAELREARVLVVVAGMEGALPSVVGGLVDRPVVAVPTSVGYGVHLQGLAALLTMMNSCAAGVGVVNVDNGFGGGYLAALINRTAAESS